MNRKKIAAAALTVAFAGAVATASCASASPAHASTVRNGKTHLLVWSVNSDGPQFRELATGAVGDYGPGVTVLPNGQVDPEHTSQLELNMSHGSFRLGIAAIHKALTTPGHWTWNTANCSGSFSFTADVPVVAGSGTGAYQGMTGSFALKVTIDEVDVKPVCDGTSGFLSQLILMDGTGNVSY